VERNAILRHPSNLVELRRCFLQQMRASSVFSRNARSDKIPGVRASVGGCVMRRKWFHIGLVDNAPISTRLSPTSRIRRALHCDPFVIR